MYMYMGACLHAVVHIWETITTTMYVLYSRYFNCQVLVRLVAGTSHPLLGSYQRSLPRLPLPSISDTCSRVSCQSYSVVALVECFESWSIISN